MKNTADTKKLLGALTVGMLIEKLKDRDENDLVALGETAEWPDQIRLATITLNADGEVTGGQELWAFVKQQVATVARVETDS